jgi:hypothetical protein
MKEPPPPPTPPKPAPETHVDPAPPHPKPAPPPPPTKPPPPTIALVANSRVTKTNPLPVAMTPTATARTNDFVNNPKTGPAAVVTSRSTANVPISATATTVTTIRGVEGQHGPEIASATAIGGRGRVAGTGPQTASNVFNDRAPARSTGTSTGAVDPTKTGRTIATASAPPPQPPGSLAHPPQVISEPNANDYITADAKKNHIEGKVMVTVLVKASGVGQVVGLSGAGLGHGLDEASLTVARLIKWHPATDAAGHPVDAQVTIGVRFQSAGVE